MTPSKLSASDLYYADVRFVDYIPQKTSTTMNGFALMEAAVSGNAPILEEKDGSELRGLLTYNIAPLSNAQTREAYLRWNTSKENNTDPFYLLAGRFYVPFGLLSDEHRTYTRIQTNMTYNNFSVGLGASKVFFKSLQADLALVNDFQSGGGFTNRQVTWGTVFNLRWNPESLPFFIGASANYEYTSIQPKPYALSTYFALALDRLTQNAVVGSLTFERVDAQNWNSAAVNTGALNPGLNPFFIPSSDSAYQSQVQYAASVGYYGLFKYYIIPQLDLFYKFDYLALQRGSPGDAYFRNGVGFEAFFLSNLIFMARYEKVGGMRPEIASSNVLAAQDDVFLMFRAWL
jgi:hypothetical protein